MVPYLISAIKTVPHSIRIIRVVPDSISAIFTCRESVDHWYGRGPTGEQGHSGDMVESGHSARQLFWDSGYGLRQGWGATHDTHVLDSCLFLD